MTPELWEKVRSLLESAMALPASERLVHVDAQTEDPEVRAEAGRLLAFEQDASAIFATNARAWSLDRSTTETNLDNTTLDKYRLLSEIGRGGMGTVYLAERADGTYQQRVAIKILQETIFTGRLAERFAEERQILARLTHPGIARLLDGGVTADGRPYLVLEYIDGRTIDRFCDEQQLDIDQRLRLFLLVAEAVQFAHQQLVLHLDIKPANILVTADGQPRLLDFGISRVMAEGLTRATQLEITLRLLTPRYASPEQAAGGQLGLASDVFSLATLLYRLLTGRLPYQLDGVSPLDAVRLIRDVAPLLPSKAAPEAQAQLLRGDLDNILLKALRKEPESRYGTVVEFADDIRRHLDDRPVRAHADSFRYRTAKFLRRNRTGVVATAAILAIVTASIIAVVHSALVARRQQQLAERRFQDVRRLAHSYIFDLDKQLVDVPGTVKVRASVLQNALSYLDTLSAEKINDPSLLTELGKGYMRAAVVQSRIGIPSLSDPEGAKRSLLKAYDLERRAFVANPSDITQRVLVVTNLRMLSDLARGENDLQTSETYGLQAWELGQPLLQDHASADSLDTLMRVALTLAQNRGAQSEGATLGDPLGALPWLDRLHSLTLQYGALPLALQTSGFHGLTLRHELIIRASVFRQLNKMSEARTTYEQALLVSKPLVGTGIPQTVGDMVLHYTYAEFLLETHDPARAAEIAPPAQPVLLEESGANRTQLTQVGDLLALHARIDLERNALPQARAEIVQCEQAFEALHRQRPDEASTNDQMATSFFDIGQEPNLEPTTMRRLFTRGLEILQPQLARHPENLDEKTIDAEGRMRLVAALRAHAPVQRATTTEESALLDRAESDLKAVLKVQPAQAEALKSLAQSRDLRAGKKID